MFICDRIYVFFRDYLFYVYLIISTKLFLYSISMSLSKIEKYLDRPLKTHKFQTKYGILLSSSKGNYVKPHSDILKSVNFDIEFACKAGGTFPYQFHWLKRNLPSRVSYYGRVVIFVWLGTCDLTVKTDQYIDLKHGTEGEAVSAVTTYIQNFVSFAAQFPTVELYFIEIPPYSIVEWNRYKGHPSPSDFQAHDILLDRRVILINEVIKQVNDLKSFSSPRFRLDVQRYRKQQGGNQRRSINFNLFKDGIHPSPTLARCWMKRLVSKIIDFC